MSLGYLLAKARYFAMEKGLSLRRKILWFGQESLQWSLLCGLASVFIAIALVFSKSRSGVMIFLVTLVLAGAAIATWREVSAETESGADPDEESRQGNDHRSEHGHTSAHARRRPRRRFRWVVRLVAAAVLAVALWLGIGPIVQRFADIDITKDNRSTFAKNTAELISDYRLAGTGKGTFLNAYAMVEKVDPGVKLSFAHNDYLQFTAENGVIAGACLIAAALWLLAGSVRRWARRRGNFAKGIGLGAMLGVAAILIHGFTDFNLQITANAVYFVALCALLVTVVGAKTAAGERLGGRARESRARSEGNVVGAANNQPKSEMGDPAQTFSFRPNARIRPLKIVGCAAAALVVLAMLVFAGRDFLGSHYLGRYVKARSEARSVQSALPVLERLLATAENYSANPEISREAGRLYVEMAKVENEAGNAEKRDAFCDKAVAQYTLTLACDPIDAFAQFEMGMAYLYYNYPMLTYAEKSKLYFRRALALKPDDEFLNLNILFLYLTWWDDLTTDEKAYATERLKAIRTSDPAFSGKLEQRWIQTFGSPDKLKTILGSFWGRTNLSST